MAMRMKKRMGLFHEVTIQVHGEILAVGLPPSILTKYKTPTDFMNSMHYQGIAEAAARLGTDELHFGSTHTEFPCFGETTLRGCEGGGEGWWFIEWNEWVTEELKNRGK